MKTMEEIQKIWENRETDEDIDEVADALMERLEAMLTKTREMT